MVCVHDVGSYVPLCGSLASFPVSEQDKNLLLLLKLCPQALLKLGTRPSVFLRRMRFDQYQPCRDGQEMGIFLHSISHSPPSPLSPLPPSPPVLDHVIVWVGGGEDLSFSECVDSVVNICNLTPLKRAAWLDSWQIHT